MHQIFLDYSAGKLRQLAGRIDACVDRLNNDQIWWRGADAQNAVGNLVLHLAGNVGQWILHAIGGASDKRARDQEFAARGDVSAAELRAKLQAVVEEAASIISRFPAERLQERILVQGYKVTVLEAIYHVVEHFAEHTGQIIYATKLLTEKDLGFYKHLAQPAHGGTVP